MKKLQSDQAARAKDLEAQKTLAYSADSACKAAKSAHAQLETELVELKNQLTKSEGSVKDLGVQSKTFEEKCR